MTRRVYAGGTIVDPVLGRTEADVLVEGDRILEVGSGLDGDEVVDCSGKFLTPGLFDCHVHLAYTHINLWRHIHTPLSYNFYLAIGNMMRTLECGITSVRDASGADLGMKEAVDDGLVPGPRMQISLAMMSQTGGHGDGWNPSGIPVRLATQYPGRPSGLADGPEEVRKKVRELVRAGADVIKVATSGGVLSPRDEPTHAHYRPEELEILVAEAEAAGIWVMAHAQAAEGIKNAVRAGIRSIEHGIYLDDEAIELMLEHGTYLVPTLVAPTGVEKAVEAGAQISEAALRKAGEVIEIHRESFSKAVAAGVNIAMGTDSAVTPHGDNLEELELMVDGGQTPQQAFASATIEAARLMGVNDDLGSLEPGKLADLVVVGSDPLEFSTLKSGIEQVWKAGKRLV
ncbi:MAG: amidohydrolase family protein [Acidimicrobiia bacterium]|nr:amidohydrolase family protein [Acidimicrobiia bacterium]MBT8214897.1 amidohydrolase family protein [Acidimicrobiia bacterium]NNF69348.1 amidohydrolase family protein [Acidimicrobiia bacterium]